VKLVGGGSGPVAARDLDARVSRFHLAAPARSRHDVTKLLHVR
jgi:hypothetical protein